MGKIPFSEERAGNDFSGLSFSSALMAGMSKSRSFFNGCNFDECELDKSDFSHCEFSESYFKNTKCSETNFSGSDFVGSTFEKCDFYKCKFQTGEWRNAKFIDCKFDNCDFDHTTITLTEFEECVFNESSVGSIQQRSIYLNVFHLCVFLAPAINDVFCSRNYGVTCFIKVQAPVLNSGEFITIEQLCLRKNTNQLCSMDFIRLARGLSGLVPEIDKLKSSTLQFITIALRSASLGNEISPPALVQLEDDIVSLASRSNDPRIYNLILALALEIRGALRDVWQRTSKSQNHIFVEQVDEVRVYFRETFSKLEVDIFTRNLSRICLLEENSLKVIEFENGSTTFVIKILGTTVLALGALLSGISQVVRQANEVVIETTKLVDNLSKLKIGINELEKPLERRGSSTGRETSSPLPLSQLAPPIQDLFSLVDEPAEIRILRSISRSERDVLAKMDRQPTIAIRLKEKNFG